MRHVSERDWHEARSRHFVVQGDLPEADLVELAHDFEQSYAAVRSALFASGPESIGRTQVIALRYPTDYQQLTMVGARGTYMERTSSLEDFHAIVLPDRGDESKETVRHELTHRFVASHYPAVAPWLNEGLAELLATARVEGAEVVVGEPRRRYTIGPGNLWSGSAVFSNVPTLDTLHDLSYPSFKRVSRSYAGAWTSVHVLFAGDDRRRGWFDAYLRDLQTGRETDRDLVARHLDGERRAEVGRAQFALLSAGADVATVRFPLEGEIAREMQTRALGVEESVALWGRLSARDRDHASLGMLYAERAIQLAPQSPEGHLLRGTMRRMVEDGPGAEADFRAALALAPKDARCLHALGTVLIDDKTRRAEVDDLAAQLIAVGPGAPAAFRFLAEWSLRRHDAAGSFDYAQRGLALDSGSKGCLAYAAAAAYHLRRYEQAVDFQRRLLAIVADRATEKLLSRLARYEAALASQTRLAEPATSPAP